MPTIAAVADRGTQRLGGEPPDDAPRQVLGTHERRREVDRIEGEAARQLIGRGRDRRVAIDDPDLDDALGPGALQQTADLRPGHARGDQRLRSGSRRARSRAG